MQSDSNITRKIITQNAQNGENFTFKISPVTWKWVKITEARVNMQARERLSSQVSKSLYKNVSVPCFCQDKNTI